MNPNAESFYKNRFQNTLGLSIDQEILILGKFITWKDLPL